MEGIITGVGKRSRGSWREIERGGHETKEKDEESEERAPAALGIEGRCIVNRGDPEKSHAKE